MKIFRRNNFLSKDWFWLLIIFVFALLASRTLIHKGYFPMHDDLQMMRQLEMEKCIQDLQIPCRWVPDMGYGFGFPLFNYYPPLPYIVGMFFRILNIAFTDVAKILFGISFFASGVSMYFFAKEIFSAKSAKLGKLAGTVSSIFYIWAPYHAVDVFVRGAMNESWAMIFFPLILWTSYKLIKEGKNERKWILALTFSWVGLFFSHNLMVLIFTPIFAVWCFIFFLKEKKWKKIVSFAKAGVLILGLVAFFTIPAFLEQKYVQVGTLTSGYYEYIAHFATANQLLLSRFWGYGASIWGPVDEMAFPVGHFHWTISLIVLVYVVVNYIKTKKVTELNICLILLIVIGWLATFMCHSRSTFIWKLFSPLSIVQFPWRFLTLVIFSFSFVAGALVLILSKFKKLMPYLIATILIGLVAWNWNFFKIERSGPVTDVEKFSGEAWRLQQTAGIYDYLPNTAKMAPQSQRGSLVEIVDGEASISSENEGTNWATFTVDVSSEVSELQIGILEFPNWKAFVDGSEVEIFIPESETWGRIHINVPQGEHEVSLRLENTIVRTITNIVSLTVWIGLVIYLVIPRKWSKLLGTVKI